jgi:uncharacterized protein (TIGR00369 family)
VSGGVPDFWQMLGLAVVDVGDDDDARFEVTCPDWVMSPFGTVHGGALSMIFDTTLAVAIARRLSPPEDRIATHQLTVSYASFTSERRLACRTRIVSLARTVAVAEGEILEPGGKLVAKALGTFGVRRRAS